MIGRSIRIVSVLVLSVSLLLFWPSSPVASESADVNPGAPQGISLGDTAFGVGMAFDGNNLWYTLPWDLEAPDTKIYGIDATTGEPVATLDMFDLVADRIIVPGGLAWDPNSGHLWVATMFNLTAIADEWFGDGEIFEIDPAGPTLVSSFITSPITEAHGESFRGVIDGLAYDRWSGTLWFSPLESLHVYEVDVLGGLVSSFELSLGGDIWNGGLTFDGNHLWLSLRTGDAFGDGMDGPAGVTLVEFTTDGVPLGAYERDTGVILPEDIAFDDVTFSTCVIWVNSIGSTLMAFDVPCPLRVEATMHPGETLDLEKQVSLPDSLPFPSDEPTVVWWEVECEPPGIEVTLTPDMRSGVAFGATVLFDESIVVPLNTAPGEYHCVVAFLSNAVPEGAVFEQQLIWITVEARVLIPCDIFDAEVEIEDDEFEVEGSCTLGAGSDGIDPPNEDVTFTLGPYTVTIPAGSFTLDDDDDDDEWEFEGVIDGVELEVEIEIEDDGTFEFEVEGEGADLTGIANPVEVMLTVGDDTGSAVVFAEFDDDDNHDDDDDEDGPSPLAVHLDIKPRSCRNPLNVKSKGVLPVALLGTESFDVSQIDPGTIRLEGVAPLRWSTEDVATPFEPFTGKEDAYDCTKEGPDGFVDLALKFKTRQVVAALGDVSHGDVLVLKISGTLWDGRPFQGEDVVVILKKGKEWRHHLDVTP